MTSWIISGCTPTETFGYCDKVNHKVLGLPVYSNSVCAGIIVATLREDCQNLLLESLFMEGLMQYHSDRDLPPWNREGE